MGDTASSASEGDLGYKYIIDILYGPTEVCGIVKYRTGQIYHIKEKLEKRGFAVNLRRSESYGMVAFAFEGQTVFTCAAKYLSIPGRSCDDPVLCRAIRKLLAERQHADSRKTAGCAAGNAEESVGNGAGVDETNSETSQDDRGAAAAETYNNAMIR